jgi:hypothetical protein
MKVAGHSYSLISRFQEAEISIKKDKNNAFENKLNLQYLVHFNLYLITVNNYC